VRVDALRQGGALVVFSCRVDREGDAALLAEGVLSVFEPRDRGSLFPRPPR